MNEAIGDFIIIGTVIAMAASAELQHSMAWIMIHGLLSWIYVIYYAINY